MERQGLSDIFKEILGTKEQTSSRVYFQPPEKEKMVYPAILYEFNRVRPIHADNLLYRYRNAFKVTVIDEDPDSVIWEKILKLPYCALDSKFEVDNLNHWVFTLFY